MAEEIFGTQDDEMKPAPVVVSGSKVSASSLLDEFVEDAQREIHREVTFPIRRGKIQMFARFIAVVELDEIKRYKRAAMGNRSPKKATPDDMDMLVANGMVLIEKNIGIYRGGTDEADQVFTTEKEPLTFRSQEFLDIYPDRLHAVDALKKFLGDAQLTTMGEALYEAAGYGEDLAPVDPTDG